MSTALTHAEDTQITASNGRIALEPNPRRIRAFFAGHARRRHHSFGIPFRTRPPADVLHPPRGRSYRIPRPDVDDRPLPMER